MKPKFGSGKIPVSKGDRPGLPVNLPKKSTSKKTKTKPPDKKFEMPARQ